jgi:hypothetical protein
MKRAAGIALTVWAAVLLSDARSVEVFPLDQIRPGMRGKSLTVLQGTQVEEIETEILGVQRGALGPGRDLIIGRLIDPRTATSGAVHGMSGSPLMIEGKWAGALSRRLMIFEKDGHCGFTPAEDMLDVERRSPGKEPSSPWKSGRWLTRETWGDFGLSTQAPGDLLGIPVLLPHWDEATAKLFGPLLRSVPGLVPVAGRVGGGAQTKAALPLQPGNALAVVLMDGDVEIAGTGTLTWTDGKRFMGFGHPMLGVGETRLPVAPAEIITIVPSYYMPHKLSNSGPIQGAMTQDRLSAISGRFDQEAPMGRYRITRRHEGEARPEWRGRFAQHEMLTPFLIAMALRNALMDEQDFSVNATLRIRGTIGLEGLPPLKLDGLYSGGSGERMSALLDQIFPLLQLTSAFPKQVNIQSLDAEVETFESARVWDVIEMRPQTRALRPGQRVQVEVLLRSLEGEERRWTQSIQVPEEIRAGAVELRLLGGASLQSEQQMEGLAAVPESPAGLLRGLRYYPSDRAYLQLGVQSAGSLTEGWKQTGLPASVARLSSSQRSVRAQRHVVAETIFPVDGVIRRSSQTLMKVELP